MKSEEITSAVPRGRFERFARMGSLASGVAGSMLAGGLRQFAQGKWPQVSDLLLTPDNARRVADQLAQLRGAAMKVGQLLSMDAGDLLPPELTAILSRLRADAQPMPMSQLVPVLRAAWGEGWDQRFQRFSFTSLAAASIGQVHAATARDGQCLAIKVQYPGVRQSIDSDVDNVATLLRLSGLLPRGLDLSALLVEAKAQLHAEADYQQEAAHLTRYGGLLADSPQFVLPQVRTDLSTENILAMSFVDGVPVESLVTAPQEERDRLASLLFALLFREIFDFGCVQTDPNFANYLYDPQSKRLGLLDFGATRRFSAGVVEAYLGLLRAGRRGDRKTMAETAEALGYFRSDIPDGHLQQVLDIFLTACEPLRQPGVFDFGTSDLARRMRDMGLALSRNQDNWHTPPVNALFLHRKIGGLYLLAARLRARVNIAAQFEIYD